MTWWLWAIILVPLWAITLVLLAISVGKYLKSLGNGRRTRMVSYRTYRYRWMASATDYNILARWGWTRLGRKPPILRPIPNVKISMKRLPESSERSPTQDQNGSDF